MIYLDKNTNEINIPVVDSTGISKIKLEHQITHNVIELTDIVTEWKGTYWNVTINSSLANIENGQYDYKLISSGDNVIEEGILQFGDYIPTVTNYTHDDTIIQYKG